MLFHFFSVSNHEQRGSVHFWRAALGRVLQHSGPCPRTSLEFFAAEFPPGCLSLVLFSLSQITSCCVGIFLVPTKMLQFAGIHRDHSTLYKPPCLHPHLLVHFFPRNSP